MHYVPKNFSNLTPSLVMADCAAAIEFYKKAFGAEEIKRMHVKDGSKIMHAELKVGGQLIVLSDELNEMAKSPKSLGGTSVSMLLYVENCEKTFDQALRAGARTVMEPQDMFWGDRMGVVSDPEGHVWALGTHLEDVTPETSRERIAAGAGD